MFTPQVSWLSAPPWLPHFSQQTRSTNRNPPSAAPDLTLYYFFSLGMNLFFTQFTCYTGCFVATSSFHILHRAAPAPLSIHLTRGESSLNRISTDSTKKFTPAQVAFFPVKWQSDITIESISSSCSSQLLLRLRQKAKMSFKEMQGLQRAQLIKWTIYRVNVNL